MTRHKDTIMSSVWFGFVGVVCLEVRKVKMFIFLQKKFLHISDGREERTNDTHMISSPSSYLPHTAQINRKMI